MCTIRPETPSDFAAVYEVNRRAFMLIELVPGALEGICGLVRFPPAFDGA